MRGRPVQLEIIGIVCTVLLGIGILVAILAFAGLMVLPFTGDFFR